MDTPTRKKHLDLGADNIAGACAMKCTISFDERKSTSRTHSAVLRVDIVWQLHFEIHASLYGGAVFIAWHTYPNNSIVGTHTRPQVWEPW